MEYACITRRSTIALNMIKKTLLALSLLGFPAALTADPVAAPVRAEIDALLGELQRSGCQFNRNGAWHSGAEAREHLLRKFNHLERRSAIDSAEQFIGIAASQSSTTGKAYLVKCGSEAPVESRQWLTKQLAAIRQRGEARENTARPKSSAQPKFTGVE